jgi:prepilin-type N-terminal cleavage/methylation domain-containing protein
MKMNKIRQQNGFTLLETLFATMLLGLVIAALAAASGAFTMANGYGLDLSTSEFLIEELREYTANESFADLVTYYDGQNYNPPVDVTGASMPDFSEFSQQITVDHVRASDLTQIDGTGTSDFVRVTVTVSKNGESLNSTSWIRANLD